MQTRPEAKKPNEENYSKENSNAWDELGEVPFRKNNQNRASAGERLSDRKRELLKENLRKRNSRLKKALVGSFALFDIGLVTVVGMEVNKNIDEYPILATLLPNKEKQAEKEEIQRIEESFSEKGEKAGVYVASEKDIEKYRKNESEAEAFLEKYNIENSEDKIQLASDIHQAFTISKSPEYNLDLVNEGRNIGYHSYFDQFETEENQVFEENTGVCLGMSLAECEIFQKAGLDSEVLIFSWDGTDENGDAKTKGHAVCLVKLTDEQYYVFDPTADVKYHQPEEYGDCPLLFSAGQTVESSVPASAYNISTIKTELVEGEDGKQYKAGIMQDYTYTELKDSRFATEKIGINKYTEDEYDAWLENAKNSSFQSIGG